MQNEFYEVHIMHNSPFFFKSKDKAFEFLWQEFLDAYADEYTEEGLAVVKEDMNYYYQIKDFGEVLVRGFED